MPEITLTVDRETRWAVTLDGTRHELAPGCVSVAQASALRVQSHGAWRWPTLAGAVMEGEIGPEEIAALVFMARRQAGEDVTYDAVAAAFDQVEEVRIDLEAHAAEDEAKGVPDPEG